MASNLCSADHVETKIYQHDGFSASIIDSFSSPGSLPSDIAWDGDNILSLDDGSDKIYKHDGFSSIIMDSFSSPSWSPTGIAWDGDNVLSADDSSGKIYKHSGFSSTVTDSFSSPSTLPTGLIWNGDLCSADNTTDKIYKHDGFSAVITDSFSSPSTGPYPLAWDGTNLLSADYIEEKIYKHSGFSSTITDSFSSPAAWPYGLTWQTVSGNVTIYPSAVDIMCSQPANTLQLDCVLGISPIGLQAIANTSNLYISSAALNVTNARIYFSILKGTVDREYYPISSFALHLRNGKPSQMEAIIPGDDQYFDSIRERLSSGKMFLEQSINDGSDVIFWVDIENAVFEETAREKHLLISGTRTVFNDCPKSVTIVGVETKRKVQEIEPIRELICSILNKVNPGDTVKSGDYEYQAHEIIYTGDQNKIILTIRETETAVYREIFYPAESADDYYWYASTFRPSYSYLIMGNYWGDSSHAGIRFRNIQIPQGANIMQAFIALRADDALGNNANLKIHGNNVDNASLPENASEADALALTAAYQDWLTIPKWVEGYQYFSPDIKNIIQEIINRPGWNKGNALQILLKDNGSGFLSMRNACSIDASIGQRAQLHVMWEA